MSRKSKVELSVILPEQRETPVIQSSAAPQIQLDFDAWWMLKSQIMNLKPQVKTAIKKHFEARGFMANQNFDEGLKDFGY